MPTRKDLRNKKIFTFFVIRFLLSGPLEVWSIHIWRKSRRNLRTTSHIATAGFSKWAWSPGFKVGGCARRCSSYISGRSRKGFSPGWGNWGVGWNVFLFTRKLIWRRFIYRFWRLNRGFAWNWKNKNV